MTPDDPGKESERKAGATAKGGQPMAAPAPNLQLVPTRATFREVYDAEFAFVWRLVRRFGVEERNAEDGAQEVFFRFHQNFASWDQARPVRALLGGYAFRVSSEMRKRASTRREKPATGDLPDVAHPGDARMEGRLDAIRLVDIALRILEEDERNVVVLALLEERPMREVAEILGENENTCSGRLRRAKERFLPRLTRLLRGET
jgi:RNA polymerase sigma-70 factor, ECF subfamily